MTGESGQHEAPRLLDALAPTAARDEWMRRSRWTTRSAKTCAYQVTRRGTRARGRSAHVGAARRCSSSITTTERERDAEREVEHAHRHEPVVDHRPDEEARRRRAARGSERAAGRSAGGRARSPRGRSGRSCAPRPSTPTSLPDEVEPREERRVRLEEAVEDELGVLRRVADDGVGRQVVRKILERRELDERDRPGGEDEQNGADRERELGVRQAREPATQPREEAQRQRTVAEVDQSSRATYRRLTIDRGNPPPSNPEPSPRHVGWRGDPGKKCGKLARAIPSVYRVAAISQGMTLGS